MELPLRFSKLRLLGDIRILGIEPSERMYAASREQPIFYGTSDEIRRTFVNGGVVEDASSALCPMAWQDVAAGGGPQGGQRDVTPGPIDVIDPACPAASQELPDGLPTVRIRRTRGQPDERSVSDRA